LLRLGQGGAFAEGAERDDAGAAVVHQPRGVAADKVVIHREIVAKRRRHGGDDALPVHGDSPRPFCLLTTGLAIWPRHGTMYEGGDRRALFLDGKYAANR